MEDKIIIIAKRVSAVIGGTMAVVGIVSLIYTQGGKAEQKKRKDSTIEFKVDKLIKLDSVKAMKIDQMLILQKELTLTQGKFDVKLDNLNRSYILHLKNDKKVDELILYFEDVKKNKELNLYPTVFGQRDI